jgi:DNA repair photolyase
MDQRSGTKEWAEKNVNFQIGCENNCSYCYARRMNQRYDSVRIPDWSKPKIDLKKVAQSRRTRKSTNFMFPSSHDITENNLNEYKTILKKLLDAGNNVLVVSKPRIECIKSICADFQSYKKQILFRFTIGSSDNTVLGYYEPNATEFQERLACLKLAHSMGYETSVSCEPMLDLNIEDVVTKCLPYVTESLWLGIMSLRNLDRDEDRAIFSQITSRSHCQRLWNLYGSNPKIKWKHLLADRLEELGLN